MRPGRDVSAVALALGLAAQFRPLVVAQRRETPDRPGFVCKHCEVAEAFGEFLQPNETGSPGYYSDVHSLWATHVEVIPFGDFEPPSFHEKLAKEAINGWKRFRDEIAPGLPNGHFLKRFVQQHHAGALNDGFFHFQKNLFEAEGNLEKSLRGRQGGNPTPPPDANSSWPQMNELPEYNRLRKYVEILSRRYLLRSGVSAQEVKGITYSIFNWCAVHGPGEFHGPHTHVGEYHVGVFYAQAGDDAGKLRFGDPRGQSPPFGRTFFHTPRSGDLIFFPSWLSHMATVTAPATSKTIRSDGKEEPKRVVFSFNIGPVQGPLPCHYWWSDPTSEMRFTRTEGLDPKELGL
jgi:hypothetical protein